MMYVCMMCVVSNCYYECSLHIPHAAPAVEHFTANGKCVESVCSLVSQQCCGHSRRSTAVGVGLAWTLCNHVITA